MTTSHLLRFCLSESRIAFIENLTALKTTDMNGYLMVTAFPPSLQALRPC